MSGMYCSSPRLKISTSYARLFRWHSLSIALSPNRFSYPARARMTGTSSSTSFWIEGRLVAFWYTARIMLGHSMITKQRQDHTIDGGLILSCAFLCKILQQCRRVMKIVDLTKNRIYRAQNSPEPGILLAARSYA